MNFVIFDLVSPSMIRRPLALLVAVSLATASPVAFAQPRKAPTAKVKAIRDELPDSARREWDAALDLYGNKDFKGAAVAFQRAYDLSKNPRVLFNLGVCYKSLGQYWRAASALREELAIGAGKLPPSEEADAKATLALYEEQTSTLEVTVNEPGATVYVDDIERGVTPLKEPLVVNTTSRTVKVRKDEFLDATQEVNLDRGKLTKITVTLQPRVKRSLVSIKVDGAAQASIFVDGTDMGPAPFKGEVVEGRHTFEARAPGFVTARQTSEVKNKEPLNLVLTLASERHMAKVRIVTQPPDASISIDGKTVGTGTWQGLLTSGTGHQLVARRAGYDVYTEEIVVKDDDSRSITAILPEESSRTWVWWTIGTLAVVGGGAVATYFVARQDEPKPIEGTVKPVGITFASFPRF